MRVWSTIWRPKKPAVASFSPLRTSEIGSSAPSPTRLMTEPMHIMIRPLDNPGVDRLVEDRRQLSGNHLIVKWDSARAVLRALHQNEAVGVLIDQNTSLAGRSIRRFLRDPACANTAFAKIAGEDWRRCYPRIRHMA